MRLYPEAGGTEVGVSSSRTSAGSVPRPLTAGDGTGAHTSRRAELESAHRVAGRSGTAGTLDEVDYRALARFRRSLRAFLHFSEEAARQAGVNPAQHQLLVAIRGAEGSEPPSVGDLAETLMLRHHSAVELINRAQAAGLVLRVEDAADHRRQRVVLTALGTSKLSELSSRHREELRRFREEGLAALRDID
jgi:DNA-binding MarR family transcriptional regulator